MSREISIAQRRQPRVWVLFTAIALALVALQAFGLFTLGLPAICACGHVDLWHGNPSGPETSQHLVDWYTYTHVIHGMGFYLLLWLVAPRASFAARLVIAVWIEVGWEILENLPFIVNRYRQSAMARGYFGDSVVNSVADTFAAVSGFVAARLLPVRVTIAFVFAMELFGLYMIRDNLALNIIQLVHRSEVISRWQEAPR